jgi:hypothetical protein
MIEAGGMRAPLILFMSPAGQRDEAHAPFEGGADLLGRLVPAILGMPMSSSAI